MKKNFTEMVFILDRSGSMAGLEQDTVGGFNAMIKAQKKEEGEAVVTTVLFSNDSEVIHDRIPLDQMQPLIGQEYRVGGCTALMDAIGDTIRHIGSIHKYAREEDVPEHTIFAITTDGYENASRRYSSDEVKKMIEYRKEHSGWEFIFVGANIDAVETAKKFGIDEDHSVDFVCDPKGTALNYEAQCDAVSELRSAGRISSGWKRKLAEDHKERRSKK